MEDAAQGFGGNINEKVACSFGEISATSFFPSKPLGCYGDGGAVFTDDDAIAERLRSIRAGGKSPLDKYDNREVGTNSRLDALQAAILLPKFKAFAEYELKDVNKVARWYTERLKDKVITPYIPEGYYSSWAQYTIRLKNKEERDATQAKLKEVGIPSMIYYPRGMHQLQVFRYMNLSEVLYTNAVEATKTVLSLPMHQYLDEETVDEICSVILKLKQCGLKRAAVGNNDGIQQYLFWIDLWKRKTCSGRSWLCWYAYCSRICKAYQGNWL